MSLHSEIFEQPERLAHLLRSQRKTVEGFAAQIARRDVPFAFLAARGTSDNAGRYANYLLGGMNRLPVALATPSLFTLYRRPPDLHGALVVGVSQSGQSPDIVSVLEEGKRQKCLTLAITNSPKSPLARAADFVLDIQVGPELAVAATKSYSGELMGIAMLSAAMLAEEGMWELLEKVPGWVSEALKLDAFIAEAVARYRSILQCVVLGRGYNYCSAFEWALKLKELAYVEAEPYSSADFQHGPIALITGGFAVLAVTVEGRLGQSMLELLQHLRDDLSADVVVISNQEKPLSLARIGMRIAADMPEFVSPLTSIVPAQLFAYHLAIAKGYDPDKPRTISKVTETR